ncbi:MAG: helix-turn-helix transcriptional regulator [Lachnospiraceae bacterium]|nr:helix-turn-helix transcriptional regulator [Lachnospiraceae bacterium]
MLNENLKHLRKAKGLSQEELAIKLNVVRQTVSKWENGLSVPDSEMLIKLADALDTSVNVILGESVTPDEPDENTELKMIAAKLELLNEQFARQNEARRKRRRIAFIVIGVLAIGSLLFDLVIWLHQNHILDTMAEKEAISAIGGYDGPTAIMVATMQPTSFTLPAIVALIVAGIGIYKTKRE